MRIPTLAVRLTLREWRAGHLLVLLAAVALAVTASSAVGMLAERVSRALQAEANRLLGGDLVLRADLPIAPEVAEAARARGLAVAQTAVFPSMVSHQGRFQLAELVAISDNHPLRGAYLLRLADGSDQARSRGPGAGEAWVSGKLLRRLELAIGDELKVGSLSLVIGAEVLREPDVAFDYFDVAPRVVLPFTALPETGLVQTGSRITWRLLFAGPPDAIAGLAAELAPRLARGQRLETARDGRPELRVALERARLFLGMSVLAALALAAAAVALAARRHAERHLDLVALLRVFGAGSRQIGLLLAVQLIVLAVLAAAAGLLLALPLQALVAAQLAAAFGSPLPGPGWTPAIVGFLLGFVLLVGFALPAFARLRAVPALRVLRRDAPVAQWSGLAVVALALITLAGLAWLMVGDADLAAIVLGGLFLGAGLLAAMAFALIRALSAFRGHARGPWRLGLAAVAQRGGSSIAQAVALGLSLAALLLLVFGQRELLAAWRQSLPDDAPNRFLINAQDDQVEGIRGLLAADGVTVEALYPMVRGRLVAINGDPVRPEAYAGERARRLAEREFNLSSADRLKPDNRIVAGRFHADQGAADEASVEEGIARALGLKLGDRLRFDVAGTPVEATVTSLRKVDWGSFTPNFFVLFPPALLADRPTSWIASFHLPADRLATADALLTRYPNLSLIDLDRVAEQVRSTADQVSTAAAVVFQFALLAGVLVLLAAVAASQDERVREAAVLRTLGASSAQLRRAHLAEFLSLGALAGIAAVWISVPVTWLLADEVFEMPFRPSPAFLFTAPLVGAGLVALAGLLATAPLRRQSVRATLAG